MPNEMLDVDNGVLETEIADLLNRSNAKIPSERTAVSVRTFEGGRHSCRIEIFGEVAHRGVEASFEDFLGEGFFLRAERSLALQLETGPVAVTAIPKP